MKTNSLLAPPDATHWSPKNGSFYTERDGKFYQWGSSGIAPVLTTHDWIAQLIPVDSAAPVWNGEGLPPVGVECRIPDNMACGNSFLMTLEGKAVTIVAHTTIPGIDEIVAVFRYQDDDDALCWHALVGGNFEPIKTPEQLAAEQRERAITRLVDMICHYGATKVSEHSVGLAAALYDAGARLPE